MSTWRFKTISVIVCLLLALSALSGAALAHNDDKSNKQPKNNTSSQSVQFRDVSSAHWAHDAIRYMASKNILSGYSDGTFQPDRAVTRAEFAKVMVLALNLNTVKPSVPTFQDLSKEHWAYTSAESAKFYLTGFRTSSGDLFRPDDDAVREDMAVALVKAKKLDPSKARLSVLDVFTDKDQISANLLDYAALAVEHGIMAGSPADNGRKVFKPLSTLTRAEAAQLLYSVMDKKDGEKVTYGNEEGSKVTYDGEGTDTPIVTASVERDKVLLKWTSVNDPKLQGYKVVISKSNPKPKHPEDGALRYIEKKHGTQTYVHTGDYYSGGDINDTLKSGQTYYFSISAYYGDYSVPGNVIQVTMP